MVLGFDDPASFWGQSAQIFRGKHLNSGRVSNVCDVELPHRCLAGKRIGRSEMATCLTERPQARMPCSSGLWCRWIWVGATTSDKQKGNKKHSKYLGNVTPNVGLVRESPKNLLNSGLGSIVICPEVCECQSYKYLDFVVSTRLFHW